MENRKKRILFVDDEPNILHGLRRILRPMQAEWETEFAESAREALIKLSEKEFDAVVADAQMPEMNGIELLNRISKQYPQVVRMVLSGEANEKMILKAIVPTHQYLSKPCEIEVLKGKLTRAFALRDLLKSHQLRDLVTQINKLPSLPNIYLQLVEELKSPDASIKTVGAIISQDVGMVTEILKIVNSAYFGLRRRVTSPAEAVNFLGLDIIKALVLSTQVFSQFKGHKVREFSLETLYSHCLDVAILAKKIAETQTEDKLMVGETFMAGLLHDIGKLILADNLPEQYGNVLRAAKIQTVSLCREEEEMLGACHAEIGAYLLGLWGLPDSIVEAVAYHHIPANCCVSGFGPLSAIHIANYIVNQDSSDFPVELDSNYLARLGLNEKVAEWKNLFEKTGEEI